MTRRLLNLLTALSLLLCAAVCVLWARSVRGGAEDQVGWVFRGDRYTVRSSGGRVTLYAPPTGAARATSATLEMVGAIRNSDVAWTVAAADPEFKRPLWVTAQPSGAAAGLQWPASRRAATRALDTAARSALLLRALEDQDRFVVAHYGLRELDTLRTGEPRVPPELLSAGGVLRCRVDGLMVALNDATDPRFDSSDTHFADFTGAVSVDQLPVIREQWHRRLDRPIGAVQWWALAVSTAVVPAVRGARSAYSLLQSRRLRRAGLCEGCSYNLTGNVSGVCPECGSAA